MKRNQITVPAMDTHGKHGKCDILDLDDQSFRIFLCSLLMKVKFVGYIDGNAPAIRLEKEIPLMAKEGVSFALDKDKVK